MPPVATLAEAQTAYLKGRVEVLRERLAAMAREEAAPSRPEFLTLLWGMEDGVARAALAGLAGMLVSAKGRGTRDLYDALCAHYEAEATYFATTPVGRKQLAPLPGAELLRPETRVMGQVGSRAGGLLLGSWDEVTSKEERVQREALCQQVLAEGHPALKMLGQGGGEPLPEALRARMERLLGHDFAHVRIHIDMAAAEAARLLGARALALGTHIYFDAGQYAPGTPTGDRLLVHELVHVVQFDQGRLPGSGPLSHRDDPAEQEARAAETQVPALASGERSLVLLPEGNPQAPTALPTVPANRLGKDGAGAERGSGQMATAAASAAPILRQEREEHLPEIVIVAHGLDFQRQGHDLRVEVYWWWLLRQDGQQHRPLRGDEEPPAIANPRVHADRLLRRLEAYTGLHVPPAGRAALLGRGEFPLERQDRYTYGTVLRETELVAWFGAEPWQRFLRGETQPSGEGSGLGTEEIEREIAALPRDVQEMMGADPGSVPEGEREQFLRIARRLAQMSASDRALFRQIAQDTTDLDRMEASLEAFIQAPDDAVIAWFKEQLKGEALRRLDANESAMREVEARYRPESSPEMEAHWTRLRQLMDRDRRLHQHEEEAEDRLFDIQMSQGQLMEGMANSTLFGLVDVPDFLQHQYDELEAEAQETQAQLQEIRQTRAMLHRAFPELAACDPEDVSPDENNVQLHRRLQTTFAEIYENIASVRARVQSEDIPLSKLGPVVQEVEAAHGISRERAEQGDRLSTMVLTWLDNEDTEEALITWIGTLLGVALAVGAFFATGGLAIVLGLAGAGINLGTAGYSFERADDLYDAARTSQAGGQALVDDSEAARFNYIMGWVNLVLAGLDLTLAARASTTFLRGGQLGRRLAGAAGADVLQQLQPGDIVQFDRALQLRQAGQLEEAERVLSGLRSRLGTEVFSRAEQLFSRGRTIAQLFPDSQVITEGTRRALSHLDEPTIARLAALGDEQVEQVGQALARVLATPHGGTVAAEMVSRLGAQRFLQLADELGAEGLARVYRGLGGERGVRWLTTLDETTLRRLATLDERALRRIAGLDERSFQRVAALDEQALQRYVAIAESGIPHGLMPEQFEQISRMLRSRAGHLGDDIVVQGSRATGTARVTSDIDIAIRVSEERFGQLVAERFGAPNPGSAAERTMLHAIETGKIQAGELGLRSLRRELREFLGINVDVSTVRVGGPFDQGPFIPIW